MEPNHNHGSYLEDLNTMTNNISGYETRARRTLTTEYQPLSADYNLIDNDHGYSPYMELNQTKKIYLQNTGNLNGTIVFDIATNELRIQSDAEDMDEIKIELLLNDNKQPIGVTINGVRHQDKTITENERGNLDDSAIQYATSPDNLQQHI